MASLSDCKQRKVKERERELLWWKARESREKWEEEEARKKRGEFGERPSMNHRVDVDRR